MRLLTAGIVLALVASVGQADEAKFGLTGENTKITFIGSKPNGKHEGGFKKVTGTATVDTKDITTLKITLNIDMNSTFTDDGKLTGHLKSPDFFDVKTNPTSKFVTTKVEKGEKGYTVTGKLTLAGKTKELSFPATIDAKGDNLTLTSNFSIDRNDWGISYGAGKIDDTIKLSVSVKAAAK